MSSNSPVDPRGTILVVDDEPEVLDALSSILAHLAPRARVIVAQSGEEAFQLLEREPVKLVLCDMRMPRMDGIEVLKRIARDHPHVHRVLFTGYVDDSVTERARSAPHVDRFLQKPLEVDALRGVLRSILLLFAVA